MYWMDAAELYTAESPTQKLRKAPEINTLKFQPTFVISRSGVRVRLPAPLLTANSEVNMGEFPSGQRGQTVNLLSMTSVVRIHLPPPKRLIFFEYQAFLKLFSDFCVCRKSAFLGVNPAAFSLKMYILF